MAGQQEVVKTTRRKSSFFDRIKIALFLGVVIFVVVGSQANPPFDPFWQVFGEFVSEPGGMVLVGLFLLEVLRQIHYYISEKSAASTPAFQRAKRWLSASDCAAGSSATASAQKRHRNSMPSA